MMKFSLILFLIFGLQTAANATNLELQMDYSIDSVVVNENLAANQAQVVVRIKGNGFTQNEKIRYGFDGSDEIAVLDNQLSFDFTFSAGKHILQFYPPEKIGLAEITTAPIQFHGKRTKYISIYFKEYERGPYEIKKPVIYLYPEEKTDVLVRVKPAGELIFTYPAYDNQWECTAFPSGDLQMEDQTYNYLFWEAEQSINSKNFLDLPKSTVMKKDLVQFLETSLNQFGFTSQEKMDFITFWAPQLMRHDATQIRFLLNDDCNLFADLEIEPKPTNVLRLYMIWHPVTGVHSSLIDLDRMNLQPQNREGFTVLEWGGLEIIPELNEELVESVK